MNDIDISIIIVNYNSGILLENCIKSIHENLNCNYEVIIVDNNSTDESFRNTKKQFGNIKKYIFHNNGDNCGFANANNIGFELSNGKIIHFLNPDTDIFNSLNDDYNEILNKQEFNAVYVNKLIDANNIEVPSKNLVPLLNNYLNIGFRSNKVKYWYTGATLIIWRTFFIKIGKWSPEYFMYSEDMDLFYSSYQNGGVVYELSNPIRHIGQGCSTNTWNNIQREINVQRAFKLFFKKHNKRIEYYLIILIILFYKVINRHKDTIQIVKALMILNHCWCVKN